MTKATGASAEGDNNSVKVGNDKAQWETDTGSQIKRLEEFLCVFFFVLHIDYPCLGLITAVLIVYRLFIFIFRAGAQG